MINGYSSRLLDNAVEQLSKLPGIGKKTALRLALHLLRRDPIQAESLGNSIIELCRNVSYCSKCHNISDEEVCPICSDARRDHSQVCVVENIRDVITVENTREFHGVYHVLGGLVSPLEGIGPADLEIESLVERVQHDGVKEVILALSPTMEGDTTSFYIYRKLQHEDVEITVLARGVAMGNDLEYTDELTLGRSIVNRIPMAETFARK